jgi:mannosyltransferase
VPIFEGDRQNILSFRIMSILQKHEQTIITLILVFINFFIKVIFLSSNSLGGDEPFSVYHAQMGIASIIQLLSEGNNPPFYEIILSYWIKLFGISEFSVRFPSLIFSSITVLYIYKLGTKYLNKRIGLYASIIFIFSNYHILFAHEARVYSLLGLLSVVSMYYFIGLIHQVIHTNENNKLKSTVRKKLIILIIINTLIIYSHYFGFFIIITQTIFIVSNRTLALKCWKYLLICLVLIGLLYLPNIYVVLNRFLESSSNGTWVKPPNGLDSVYNMLRHFSNAPVVAGCVILVFVSSFMKFIINKRSEQECIYNRLIVFWFVFIFFFMFGISYLVPMFLDRYLMPAAIAFCIVLGISLDYIIKIRKYRYIIPSIIVLLFVITTKPDITNNRNVKETVDKIKDIKDSNTLVIVSPPHFILNFVYYYDREIFKDYNTDDIYSNINKSLNSENVYGVNRIDEIDYKEWDKIVFLDAAASFSDPNNNVKTELDANYDLTNHFYFYEIFNIFEYKSK